MTFAARGRSRVRTPVAPLATHCSRAERLTAPAVREQKAAVGGTSVRTFRAMGQWARKSLARCVIISVTLCAAPSAMHAQVAAPRPAGANTLTGIVTDTLNAPVSGIDVYAIELRQSTRTKSDGSFRFDSAAAGTYTVTARGLGFVAKTQKVVVGANGGTVVIRLVRTERVLPAIVTKASRGGLSGVIGDTAYKPLAQVSVRIQGTDGVAKTDSMGAFFIPIKSGNYLVLLERNGYERQMIGITVPDSEGRQMAAWMRPKGPTTRNLDAFEIADMHQRIISEKGVASKYYTHQDLVDRGLTKLSAVARISALGIVTDDCWVSVALGDGKVPIWAIDSDEIEFVEVYATTQGVGTGRQRGVTSMNGNSTKFTTARTVRPSGGKDCGGVAVIVWPRK